MEQEPTLPTWLFEQGRIEFNAVLPPITTGESYDVYGEAESGE